MTRVTAPILRCDGYASISPKRRELPCQRFVEASQAALEGWQATRFGDMLLDMCPSCWDAVQTSRQEAETARRARVHCDHSRRANTEQDAGLHWCFRCRMRVPFTDRVLVTIEPSYWPPVIVRQCPEGHTDGDIGFGQCREWNVPW